MKHIPTTLRWLTERGLTDTDMEKLNPCVPGEFTLPGVCYVNSSTPGTLYRGSEEGTLPLAPGRWYLIPGDVTRRLPALTREMVPVSRAVRSPSSISG